MSWPQTGATHCHAQLELPREMLCKQKNCCLLELGSMKRMRLEPLHRMGLVPCCQDGYRAQVPQHPYRNKLYWSC